MDQSFCRFNLTDLILRDLKETQIKKGKNLLIVASLNDEKVVLRKIEVPNLASPQEHELYYFYYIVNKNIATCLGFAIFDSDYYLVFDYATFTVEDWVSQVNIFCAMYEDDKNSKLEEKKQIFQKLVKILNDFRKRELFFEHLELSEMFIDEFLNIKIFDLRQIRQGLCSDDKISLILNHLKEKIFGAESLSSIQDDLMQSA